ncbi:hypothetical protein GTW43_32960 [Streptomyces sp. SID5785]|nr:hypothetical protein [Streptomyces sp. SID5785]MZD09858.1 hypothetical protein [Streptomyces sp. SID5785]
MLADAPPKSRATALNGSVTTVAIAPPIARRTSAMAWNIMGSFLRARPGSGPGTLTQGSHRHPGSPLSLLSNLPPVAAPATRERPQRGRA